MQPNLKSTLFDALLDASLDGIVILEPELTGDGALVDLVFTVVNDRAQEIESGGAKLVHGSGWIVPLRAA